MKTAILSLAVLLTAIFLLALAPGIAWTQEGRKPEFGFGYRGPGQAIGSIAPMDEIDAADASNLLDRRTEAAVVRALSYLKQSQGDDGRWNGEDANWVAYNAFAMIAYMLNGHFPGTKQPYGPTMSKALDAILEEAGSDGYLGTSMYAHGLATLCLSEMWGHTNKDGQVQKALKAAVDVILRSQSELGGWRYDPVPGGADVSITAMQVIALAAARQAGSVPDEQLLAEPSGLRP